MSRTFDNEEGFSDDLREVADVLRDRRPTLDPLALDRVKLRAISAARRSNSSREKGLFMRSRLTTLLVAASLTLGTGGAIALACGGVGGAFGGGSAGYSQYKECTHGKGCHGKGGEKGSGNGGEKEKGGDKGLGGDQGSGGSGGDKGSGDKSGGQSSGGDKGGKDHGHR